MSDILLTLDNIGLVRDERAILSRIQLTVARGEIVTLIGHKLGKWLCGDNNRSFRFLVSNTRRLHKRKNSDSMADISIQQKMLRKPE